ncbi:hypothetical protein C8Q77DRAFT_1247200 [Trametes polyzona]|nr:hypothetical protein C8Q77DRAFT_1247200 [Trametes polyzona]
MVLGSPSASLANKLVFWSPDAPSSPDDRSTTNEPTRDADSAADGRLHDGISMYVKVFEDMLKEVLDGEGKLFTEDELGCFMKYHRLPYPAKYLFCRLCLRKTDKWHRLSSLKYQAELGDGIRDAIEILCGHPPSTSEHDVKPAVHEIGANLPDLDPTFRLPQVKPDPDAEPEACAPDSEPKPQVKQEVQQPQAGPSSPRHTAYPVIKQEEREIIDLTFEDDEEGGEPQKAGLSQSPEYELAPTPSLTPKAPDFSVFADDEEQAELMELLDCLTIDELTEIAKSLKLKLKSKRRDAIIDDILRTSMTQGTLVFRKDKNLVQSKLPGAPKHKSFTQQKLPFKPILDPRKTQQDSVRRIVMKKLGKCIRLNADVVRLFRRANLVYFRSTQHTPELLTPALLARAKKWAFAEYPYARTRDVWRSRAELLAYEDALALEAEVDALLESPGAGAAGRGRSRSTTLSSGRTPVPGRATKTPVTPSKGKNRAVDSPVTSRGGKDGQVEEEEEESVRVQNARAVKELLDTHFPRWQALVKAKPEADDEERRNALQRFECGHILTRVVCKGAYVLGILHEYEQELEVLNALLAQKRWRRGRRGRWHERRALLLMHHFRKAADPEDVRGVDELAFAGVVEALEDEDTHIVFRPMLERRLTRLEKWLQVPAEERHACTGKLKEAHHVSIAGERLDRRMQLDEAGHVVHPAGGDEAKAKAGASLLKWVNPPSCVPRKPKEMKPEKITGKSVWKGRDGEEVSVETFALQHYEDQGYKGFHCEGRIVTTLFGLLFWDILFAAVPGAFETRYQSAPLDLAEDTFYHVRKPLADARLAELEAGRAPELIAAVFDAHEGKMCVGVRWDLFTKEDLLGIVRCMKPTALRVICKLMCEDYAARTGGVPDLIVWHETEGKAKFVEVKGPNDNLQENQKVWINVLLQAGVEVEVCHVHVAGSTPKKAKKPKSTAKTPGKTPKKRTAMASVGKKRKRAEPDDSFVVDSDATIDYDELDRHTEDEEASPAKRRRRTRIEEPESPIVSKVARLNSQTDAIAVDPIEAGRRAVLPSRGA